MVGRTSVIVAHRLATIKDVDCIYVINKGKIAEQGTHAELINHKDGLYAQYARLQFEHSFISEL
jgi:ABC-type multidrug transport system fused ATPase/permease subunit